MPTNVQGMDSACRAVRRFTVFCHHRRLRPEQSKGLLIAVVFCNALQSPPITFTFHIISHSIISAVAKEAQATKQRNDEIMDSPSTIISLNTSAQTNSSKLFSQRMSQHDDQTEGSITSDRNMQVRDHKCTAI